MCFKKLKQKAMRKYLISPELDKNKIVEIVTVADPNKKTSVIVPPTHTALVIKNGSITESHSSGRFFPVDKRDNILSLKIYFVSKTARIRIRWGTQRQQRLNYIDPKISMPVSVGAFGTMDIKVDNANKFFQEMLPSGPIFTIEQLESEIRNIVVDGLRRVLIAILKEKHISFYDFDAERAYIQEQIATALTEKFRLAYGFEICDFFVDNINIAPEEEEKIKLMQLEDSEYNRSEDVENRTYALERQRKEHIRNDMYIDDEIYASQKRRERDEIEFTRKLRHEDEDRQWQREDKVLDADTRLEAARIEAFRDVGVAAAKNTERSELGGKHCPYCGNTYKPESKYCPVCGNTLPKENETTVCPSCSAVVPWGTKHCPQCGQKLQ